MLDGFALLAKVVLVNSPALFYAVCPFVTCRCVRVVDAGIDVDVDVGGSQVVKVDCDVHKILMNKYRIRGLPLTGIFIGGEVRYFTMSRNEIVPLRLRYWTFFAC